MRILLSNDDGYFAPGLACLATHLAAIADVVVVDVQCDYHKESFGNCRDGHADIKALEDSLKVICAVPPAVLTM